LSNETEKNEEREFQLEMLDAQISCENFNSILTVLTAVSFSWVASMIAIYFSNSSTTATPFAISLLISTIIMVIAGFSGIGGLWYLHSRGRPKRINKIRNNFIKKQVEQSST
jgi:hypothetical protein